MNVGQIMTRHPICVLANNSVRQALRMMLEHDIRHLPVLDNEELVGIVTDKDVHGFIIPTVDALDNPEGAKKRLETRVSEIMESDPTTVELEDDVPHAIEVMLDERVGALAVVDPHTGKLEGIVSYVDVLRAAAPLLA